MKTLYEGILDDMESTLSRGDKDVSKIEKGEIPTLKDFVKDPYGSGYYIYWHCPYILDKYRNKYPNIIPAGWEYIRIVIDSRMKDIRIFFADDAKARAHSKILASLDGTPMSKIGNVSACKKKVIEIINILANNTKLMDILMKQEYEYWKWKDSIKSKLKNGETSIKDLYNIPAYPVDYRDLLELIK